MGKGILWNGKYYLTPQAGSRIDSSGLSSVTLGSDNNVAFLAEMTGLIPPKTAQKVSDPSLPLSLIYTDREEARLATQLLFSPSTAVAGASNVYLIPVNPCTQANSTFSNVLKLTSYLYGLTANQIKAKIEAGTTGKKVTVQYGSNVETYDNLTNSSFSIKYTGTGTACTMTINVAAATALLTTACTGATTDNLSLSLTAYKTISQLVNAIESSGKYDVTVLTGSPDDDLSIDLDNVTTQDIMTAVYTAKSDLQAIVDGINKYSSYVSAARVADAGAAPANVAWTFLAGGTEGTTTSSDWDDALSLLKGMDVQIVVALTSDASVHAKLSAHCTYMSGPNGKSERRGFVGGALQSWVSETARTAAITALEGLADDLNTDRIVHATLGCYRYDPNGNKKLYPAYLTACIYAGIAAGATPVTPLTRKSLDCLGLEVELRKSEVDTLIDAGLAPPIPDAVAGSGYVISRQITTWNQTDDLYRLEYSVGRGADYIARQVRNEHEALVGQAGTETLDITIVNVTNAVLAAAKRDGYIRNYDPKSTQLRVDGTVRYVDYWAEPILPVNFVFSTFHLQPTKFSIGI
ncbi:hypothetical protein [Oryzomonas rubra]|uniref:Tail sheath protein subtilisin-like domain-containing protein n=1 Tax=Oryzomonas rubra TaxID=2509454 RepID=A0A5A9X8N7_9BACT|nr:hypothetical protein [Oryzomonas rubra]KAA0888765.1 hypothetical protein ET418_15405 [Oryzomonas rubra]